MTIPAVLVVADDLTGATDSSVQFARTGWESRLRLVDSDVQNEEDHADGSVHARITDARSLSDAEACNRTRDAVLVDRAGADRLFLKIDSTLRGSVAGQIAGALDAWRQTHPEAIALVCSAYPAMKRTVIDDHLYVDRVPVAETVIGQDPVTPVTTSSVSSLIPGSAAITGPRSSDSLRSAIRQLQATSSVITVDASSTEDLEVIAEVVAELGETIVPVGSAGLAAALAAEWGSEIRPSTSQAESPKHVVVVASSLHTVTRAQVEALVESKGEDITVWRPTLAQVIDREERNSWLQGLRDAAVKTPMTIIDAPAERTAATGCVAEVLAEAATSILGTTTSAGLMLLGGEGARAVLDRLGAEGMRIHSTVREGIPVGTVDGGQMHGTTVVTKAGGFGRRLDVADIAEELIAHDNEGTEV